MDFAFNEPVYLLVESGDKLKLTFDVTGGISGPIETLDRIARSISAGKTMLQVCTPEAEFWANKLSETEIWNGLKLVNQYSPNCQHTFDIPGPLSLKVEGDTWYLNLTFIRCRRSARMDLGDG